jgi:DNA-binding NtrC family response regulator
MARVLLAEDDPAMLDMVKRALAADGHTVVTAQDGQEALDLLSAGGPAFDVLMTDIQMPSLDGMALAGKAAALHPKLKIVLMSAYADQIVVPAAVKPSVVHILAKPLALEKARAAVKDAAG